MKHLLITVLFVFVVDSFGQIPLPVNILKGYNKQTRSYNGKPGAGYWQNSSNYRINAELNPATRELTGYADIIYRNDSPDTLKQIVIRLYQNFYKSNAPRFNALPEEDNTSGMHITELTINGYTPELKDPRVARIDGTNLIVRLKKESFIPPNSSIKIKTSWHFTVTASASLRQGKIDSTSYFIAFWYPQIAVYDDIDGWDRINYNGEAEFYNDFSSFDVSVTVPNNYGVWATGNLQNAEEVLSARLMQRFNKANNSATTEKIIGESDLASGRLFNESTPVNTWHFRAASVPDFAFGVSSNHLWYASSPVVDKQSGRKTFLQSVIKPDDKFKDNIQDIAVKSLAYFDEEFPKIAYPYPALTIFNGRDDIGGGMEYPMIVNDPTYDTHEFTVFVTTHEIAHNYYPFYMGINERKYGWMDEGWAVTSTFDLQAKLDSNFDLRKNYVTAFNKTMGTEYDLPLSTPTFQMTGQPQQFATYMRSGLFFSLFREMIGKEDYDRVLRKFMAAWNGKHPTPYDYFYFFESELKVPLQQLFADWCFASKTADLKLKSAQFSNGKLTAVIEKTGGLPVPVRLRLYFADGTSKVITKEGFYWHNFVNEITLEEAVVGEPVKAELDTVHIPDATPADNTLEINKQQKEPTQ